MKADAATVWIKDRICQQMIRIHKHGKDKNEVGQFPFFSEEEKSYNSRKNKMKKIMNDLLHGH